MIFLFGSGEKYTRKEGGRTSLRKCPSCEQLVTFYEIVKVEYISFLFIPIVEAEVPRKAINPPFQCPNCEATFVFAQKRFTQTKAKRGFMAFVQRIFGVWNRYQDQSRKKAQARHEEKNLDREMNRLKRKMRAQKRAGDRF